MDDKNLSEIPNLETAKKLTLHLGQLSDCQSSVSEMEDNCASGQIHSSDADSGIVCTNDLQNGAFLDIPSTSSCRPKCKQYENASNSNIDITLKVLYSLINELKNAKELRHDCNQLTLDKWVRKGAKTHSIETKLGDKRKPLSPPLSLAVTSNIVKPNISHDTSEKLNHCVGAVSLKPNPGSQTIISNDFLVLNQNKIHSLQSNKQKCINHLARKKIKKNVTKRAPLKRQDVNSDEESKTMSILIDERKSGTPLLRDRKSPTLASDVINPNTHGTSGEMGNLYLNITSKELPDGLTVNGLSVPNLNEIEDNSEDVILNDVVNKCLPSEVDNQKRNNFCKKESKNNRRVTKNRNGKDLNMKICIKNRSDDGSKGRAVFLKNETHTSPHFHTTRDAVEKNISGSVREKVSRCLGSVISKEIPVESRDSTKQKHVQSKSKDVSEDEVIENNAADIISEPNVNKQKSSNVLPTKLKKINRSFANIPHKKESAIQTRSGDRSKSTSLIKEKEEPITSTSPRLHITWDATDASEVNSGLDAIISKEIPVDNLPVQKEVPCVKKDVCDDKATLKNAGDKTLEPNENRQNSFNVPPKKMKKINNRNSTNSLREKESRIETGEDGLSKSPYSLLDEKEKWVTSPQKETPHVICDAEKNISQSKPQSEDVTTLNVANENPESGVNKRKIISHLSRKTKHKKAKLKNMVKTSAEVNFYDQIGKKNSLLNENQGKRKKSERSSFHEHQIGNSYALHTPKNNGIKMRSEILDAVVGYEKHLNISNVVENEGKQGDSLKTKLDSVRTSQSIKHANKSPRKRAVPVNNASSAEKYEDEESKIIQLKNSASKREEDDSAAKLLKPGTPGNSDLENPLNLKAEETRLPLYQQLCSAGFSNDDISKISMKRLEEAAAADSVLLLIRKHRCSKSTVGPALLRVSKEQYIRTKDQWNFRKYGRIKPCFVRVEKLRQ